VDRALDERRSPPRILSTLNTADHSNGWNAKGFPARSFTAEPLFDGLSAGFSANAEKVIAESTIFSAN
jgi:hypothetical protein